MNSPPSLGGVQPLMLLLGSPLPLLSNLARNPQLQYHIAHAHEFLPNILCILSPILQMIDLKH